MLWTMTDLTGHWQGVHTTKEHDSVSWWQGRDDLWLDLVEERELPPGSRVADLGCGSSLLVDALVERNDLDITGIDISPAALDRVRARLGPLPNLHLVAADVRTVRLDPPVDLWHDRAVFHFLTAPTDRASYRESLRASLTAGGTAIVATFAEDGPESCSGLPVHRYDVDGLVAALGFATPDVVRAERRIHHTPWGSQQPFTVVVARQPGAGATAGPESLPPP